jgi:hypothetical protein
MVQGAARHFERITPEDGQPLSSDNQSEKPAAQKKEISIHVSRNFFVEKYDKTSEAMNFNNLYQ